MKGKWNPVVVFSTATILSFHPVEGSYQSWDLYTAGQDCLLQQKKKKEKKRKPVFIKGKWNHVGFSMATILPFHPVEGSYTLGICTQMANL